MARLRLIPGLLFGSALFGCGTKPVAPEPVPEPTAEVKPAVTEAKPTPSPAPAQPAIAAPTDSPLRALAARYLQSDGHGGWHTNEQAAADLEKLSPADAAKLWSLLADAQVEVRRGAAVYLLAQFDAANKEQVAAFAKLLSDSDRMVRARDLDAAKQFSQADKLAALPQAAALLDASREDRPENRAAAARWCGSLKQEAATAVPALIAAAKSDSDAKVRAAALAALAQVAEPQQVVAICAHALADPDAAVRLAAAARLRQLGDKATPAANELATALSDSSSDVAEAAGEALLRIGQPAVEPLAKQLAATSTTARRLALACLAKLGPTAKSAASAVEKCQQDSDAQVRELAAVALKRIRGN